MADDDLLIERLLRVIDEGRRTATYKLALLMALIDTAAISNGVPEIQTRVVAEQVLALYYPQTRIYVANDGIERELRQITMKGSPPLRAVLRLRLHGDAAGCRSADDTKQRLTDEYEMALDVVEDTFVRYPIPLLQVVGTQLMPFLYQQDWPEGTSVALLRRDGRDRVRLLPGVIDRLVVLGPMVRPLIELHWANDIARWTGVQLEDSSLRAHLFGTERMSFPRPLVGALREVQHGCCFYCGDRIEGRGQVDHFLAWSRWPNDAIENLVLADSCNGAKSDHLVVRAHLDRWQNHAEVHQAELVDIASSSGWPTDPSRTLALVTTTYAHLAAGTPLWIHGADFEKATGPVFLSS
jgi:hypothetical protein